MSRPKENKTAIARTSTAVAKITRSYGYYVMDCVQDNIEIMHINKFYKLMKDAGELPRSRVFETYLGSYRTEPEE